MTAPSPSPRDAVLTAWPRPICAKCNRPVERVHAEEDFYSDAVTIIVECHGSRERMLLPREIIVDVGPWLNGVDVTALAFVDEAERLEAPARQLEAPPRLLPEPNGGAS